MENIVIRGKISTTSNKQSTKFESKNPKKTAYLEVDEKTSKKLVDFGIPMYTSKEDKVDFHCVKVIDLLKLHFSKDKNEPIDYESSIESPNFKTKDGITVGINIIKGEESGNTFYRINALLISDISDIEAIESENPFADFE